MLSITKGARCFQRAGSLFETYGINGRRDRLFRRSPHPTARGQEDHWFSDLRNFGQAAIDCGRKARR
jgi:hypothetical protein